ncbi:MAG: potassium-transporting ATPase subunit KdpC [Acetobacteraceae bacterium]|jgi:K+-transporting ATPase ATPase C chain
MFSYVSGPVRASLVTFVLLGFVYPFVVTGIGQMLMPTQANGSLEKSADGTIIGSRLIGQKWDGPQWFHGRPSATMDLSDSTKAAPYNAANTTASNLGPTSKALQDRLTADRHALDQAQPELAGKTLPADMLTTSGSGLDPDITPANASLQVQRVAKARGVPPEQVAGLVKQYTAYRTLGIFGEPRVNVLQLNLALEQAFPKK